MQQIFSGQLFNALSWTLIHSLWQGLLLTIVAGMIMTFTKRSSPSLRYSLLTALLFCFIGITVLTFAWQWQININATVTHSDTTSTIITQELPPQYNWWNSFSQFMDRYSGLLIPVWAAIVLLKLFGMLADLYYVKRLRTSYINKPGEIWTNRLQQLVREMGIRKHIVLLESQLVNIPLVIGHFKPVILVPLGILTRLSPSEVEAFLLHELAHIRRHDYIVNLVQQLTSIIFFFNPGILWLSSLIRAERENCCDNIAIMHTNDKLKFVEALINVKQHSLSFTPLAMGFLGQKNLLLHRVDRIVHNRNKSLNRHELLFFVFSIVCSILLFKNAGSFDRNNTEQSNMVQLVQSGKYFSNFISPVKQEHELNIKNSVHEQTRTNRSINESDTKIKQAVNKNISIQAPITTQYSSTSEKFDQETGLIGHSQQEKDLAQAALDHKQAEKDRAAAELDRKQAEKDRAQAEIDRKQAERDRIQADKDLAQAELDHKQAEKDRLQAIREAKSAAGNN